LLSEHPGWKLDAARAVLVGKGCAPTPLGSWIPGSSLSRPTPYTLDACGAWQRSRFVERALRSLNVGQRTRRKICDGEVAHPSPLPLILLLSPSPPLFFSTSASPFLFSLSSSSPLLVFSSPLLLLLSSSSSSSSSSPPPLPLLLFSKFSHGEHVRRRRRGR
jgi:hypothetical protein